MIGVALKIQRFFLGKNFQVAVTFLLSGLLSGAILTWVIESPIIENILFFRDEYSSKAFRSEFIGFLIFLVFLILPLFVGTFISSRNRLLTEKHSFAVARYLLAFVSLGVGAWLISLLCNVMPYFKGNVLALLPMYALVFAFAMCVATRSLLLFPIAFLACITSVMIAAGITALLYPLVKAGSYEGLFVNIAPFYSLVSLCFGLWLRWQKSRQQRKDA